RTASYYLLYSPFIAYSMYFISQLISGTLFSNPGVDHPLLLGLGLIPAAMVVFVAGAVVDRTRRGQLFLLLSAAVPLILAIYFNYLGFPLAQSPDLETVFVLILFAGLASTMVSWSVLLNQTVVVRYRGRIVAAFFSFSIIIYMVLASLSELGVPLYFLGVPFPEIIGIVSLVAGVSIRPWRWKLHPLAVNDSARRYFGPMVLLLAAYILWYFSTTMRIEKLFEDFSAEPYLPLVEHSGLGILHLLFMVLGVVVAGVLADVRGRKMAFSTAVLILGNLAIFGETFYFVAGTEAVPEVIVYSIPLLAWERFLEGYLLGLCVLLVWSELGAPRRKGLRQALILWFYAGFVALFLAGYLEVPLGRPPVLVRELGLPFAVFLSLVTLWRTAPLPQIVGREIEMEQFALEFDQRMVDRTVSAFLEEEDFKSIRTQMDVIDAAEGLSDSEFTEFLGNDLEKMLPLKRVKGIGPALEQKLRRAGYDSAAQLAGETPKRLSEKIAGLGEKQAENILLNARKAIRQLKRTKR
ncbi:MAG: helix-hairpin-helix domain-containing protein, partial [Promethearchaeota archaeon]